MVKSECKWPKNPKKWRIVRRDDGSIDGCFQTQARIGWWIFGHWQDLGKSTCLLEDAIDWIETQCIPAKGKGEEEVVWSYP